MKNIFIIDYRSHAQENLKLKIPLAPCQTVEVIPISSLLSDKIVFSQPTIHRPLLERNQHDFTMKYLFLKQLGINIRFPVI